MISSVMSALDMSFLLCLTLRSSGADYSHIFQQSVYCSTTRVDLGRFFSFLIHRQSSGLCGQGISPSQGRYLHTEQHKHRINTEKHPWARLKFEPTIPVFERAKTVHALDRAVGAFSNNGYHSIRHNISSYFHF
jgi:hypothetical protein